MINDGIFPLIDYFSKDLPYFLAPYSLIMKFFGEHIYTARIGSYLFGSLNFLLVYKIAFKIGNGHKSAVASLAILASSILYILKERH